MPNSNYVLCPACGAVNRIGADRSAAAARCGGCHKPLFSGHPAEVDEQGLERHLRVNTIPVLLQGYRI